MKDNVHSRGPRERRRQAARGGRWSPGAAVAVAAALALVISASSPRRVAAQQQPSTEIAANLAAGRVVFCVAKEAMFAASVGGAAEPGSRPPVMVPLSNIRIAVLLGAVEWNHPDSGKTVRLDAELPVVAANSIRRPADKTQMTPDSPTEIEDIGIGMLELIRPLTDQLHHKLDLKPDEPLVELLLADYAEGYGPEIWSLQYRIRQENLGNDYWNTRLLRPAYYQLYPPEKGQRRTLVEVRYPEAATPPTLLAQLDQSDPQIARIRNASPELTQALALVVNGTSDKAAPDPVSDFLRAALPLSAGPQAKLALAKLDPVRGFQWVLAPEEAPPPPAQTKPQEPGAPSLRKYNPSQQR